MANTKANNKKGSTSKKSQTSNLKNIIAEENIIEEIKIETGKKAASKIPDDAIINVKSNVFGKLIYIDSKSQEEIVWDMCGTIQQVTYATLRNMKATALKFYKNQWVIITGFADGNADTFTVSDIYNSLIVSQYYKDIIDPSNYDEICAWTPSEIREKVELMSAEAKENLAVALNTYIEKGVLDSLKAIKTFEEVLGCDLKIPE